MTSTVITHLERCHIPTDPSPEGKVDAGQARSQPSTPDRGGPWGSNVPMPDAKRFPFNNFTYCFTLFSKYFSSFDHSTCLLSVSRQYLALDGIYHPFRAAFPNNPTLRGHDARTKEHGPHTGFSPSMTSCSKEIGPAPRRSTPLQPTTLVSRPDFKLELFPLHSPLLRESPLVSFPRLIDMLKFRRWSYLI